MNSNNENEINSVLDFWFKETTLKQKYSKDDEFDALIKSKFEKLYFRVMDGDTKSWRATPSGRLAEVIILDQFSRNMFRGDKQCFAADELALTLSKEALETGDDMKLSDEQKQFFYMPFMHSESREVHVEALELFKEKSDENGLKYEIAHKEIIDRFGRYPHRNIVMERESTQEELEFLKEHTGF
jgi:uncharacterized protein (DUF924 family)